LLIFVSFLDYFLSLKALYYFIALEVGDILVQNKSPFYQCQLINIKNFQKKIIQLLHLLIPHQ